LKILSGSKQLDNFGAIKPLMSRRMPRVEANHKMSRVTRKEWKK
jgi:hypothetical protein